MADPMFATPRPTNSLSLNINDVIEVIGDDLNNGGGVAMMYGGGDATGNGGGAGGSAPSEAEYSTLSTATTTVDPMLHIKQKAYVRIIEQPQAKALRFRYICEGRSAGSIPGVSSTAENKTFPSIQVMNYTGPAVVVVSCVTVDPPHRAHPHNLVGKEGCKKGVCTMTINNESMQCVFSNLGIQCVKRKDVEEALRLREEIRVDPFQTGFSHRGQPQSIDLNALRLCFQVFLEGQTKGKFTFPLKPVVSEAIYDKKATCDLLICKLSDCTSSVAGGKEVILLCDKVTKEDIQVRFYEVTDGLISWEAFGDFQPSDVHKQVAIAFKTPRYRTIEIENPVKVFIQLQRPSDKTTSEPRPFEYLPLDSGRPFMSFKRLRQSYGPFSRILGLDNHFLGDMSSSGVLEEEEDLKRKLPSVSVSLSGGGIVPHGGNEEEQQGGGKKPYIAAPPHDPASRPSKALKRPGEASASSTGTSSAGLLSPTRPPSGGSQSKSPTSHTKMSPIWSDVSSACYSDAELLEDVLSNSSVNDLLSSVGGEGCAVYQDFDNANVLSSALALTSANLNTNPGLNTAISNTLNLLCSNPSQPQTQQLDTLLATTAPAAGGTPQADVLYGDASYASCYSNLEFVMNRARVAQQQQESSSTIMKGDSLICGSVFPAVPERSTGPREDDSAIYGVPSNRPVHSTKMQLLQHRGFGVAAEEQPQQGVHATVSLKSPALISPMDLEKEDDLLPKTVLDLFV
ncbi:Rel domain (RHD) DNA-binding domain [Trinorchestia longiramus]|nr:Rel domain (RHD) DNA-binding domain [Trinorchestia longiramus]